MSFGVSPEEMLWRARLAGLVSASAAHASINALAMIGVQAWKIKRLTGSDPDPRQIRAAASEIAGVVESESMVLRALNALTSSESADLMAEKNEGALREFLEPALLLARLFFKAKSIAFRHGEIPEAVLAAHPPALIRVLCCLLLRSGEVLTPFEKKKIFVEFSIDTKAFLLAILAEGEGPGGNEGVSFWRDGNREDDFDRTHVEAVIRHHGGSIEIESGTRPAPFRLLIRMRFPEAASRQ